jgi:oligosaccharide repeat unit polymerase
MLNCFRYEAEDEFGVYSRPDILFDTWAFSLIGFIFIFLGFAFSHHVYREFNFKKCQSDVLSGELVYERLIFSKKSYSTILSGFVLVLFVTFLFRSVIGRFPIESIFMGLSTSDLVLLRSDATNGFEGKSYRYQMFMDELPLFLFILVSFIKNGYSSKKWKGLYYLLLFYNVFYAFSTLQKAPIIKLIILAIIIYLFIHKTIPKKYILLLSIFIPTLIVLMYIYFMGNVDSTATDILIGAGHRIFIGSIIPLYWYIVYVEQKGFLFGTSFPNPAGILPFEHVPLTKEIALIGQSTVGDAVGSMPTVFVGEMYVNFGILGIILSCFFFGFILQTLDIYIFRKMNKRKYVLTCSLYVYFIFYFTKYSTGALSSIILDTSLFVVLIFYVIYKNRIKTPKVKSQLVNNLR